MNPIVFYYHLEQHGQYTFGGRLLLRPVEPEDGAIIAYWRNSPQARASFFNQNVVTPDSHRQWLAAKDPGDQVFMVEVAKGLDRDTLLGMTALHVDPVARTGEYGRTFVDPRYQRQGYGTEIDYMVLALAFEVAQLKRVWLDIYADNETMLAVHAKTGWRTLGTHLTEHGRVTTMDYDRAMWADQRPLVLEKYGWQLPEWHP